MKDVYVYPNTNILINNYDIKNSEQLEIIESQAYTVAKLKGVPFGDFSFKHFKNIHKTLFGKVYPWAGEIRNVDITKGDTFFCRHEFIETEFNKLTKELKTENYLFNYKHELNTIIVRLAYYFSEINAIHPFREGNGRTIREFIGQLAIHNNLEINFNKMNPQEYLDASIYSSHCNNEKLEKLFYEAITQKYPTKEIIKKHIDLER